MKIVGEGGELGSKRSEIKVGEEKNRSEDIILGYSPVTLEVFQTFFPTIFVDNVRGSFILSEVR